MSRVSPCVYGLTIALALFCVFAGLTPAGATPLLTTLTGFTGDNGYGVSGNLIAASDGNYYGTTEFGGVDGDGTVFKIAPNGTLTTLVNFDGTNGADVAAGLVVGADGSFYGTTVAGGADNDGTVFRVTSAGAVTTLVTFTGTNGAAPTAALVLGPDGNFYGTTQNGGTYDDGTVFKMNTLGVLTTLVSFNETDGLDPESSLFYASDGNYYGTTEYGGVNDEGTVFKISPSGTLTTVLSFNGTNGAYPVAGFITDTQHAYFYGTTASGGANGDGTVFKVTSSGTLITIASFNGANGANPEAPLITGGDGYFYGTTASGGASNAGTVFKILGTTLTTLVNFTGTNGASPTAGLMIGPDGNFYGTTYDGGASNAGTVFTITAKYQVLHSFIGTDGSDPGSALVEGPDGNFYGTTFHSILIGNGGSGTLFRFTPSGILTTLYTFSALSTTAPYGNSDGAYPEADLVVGPDGTLYGTTTGGGTNSTGTIFDVTINGTLTTLHDYDAVSDSSPYTNSDGAKPSTHLVMDLNDGLVYGTTYGGGSNGTGTVSTIDLTHNGDVFPFYNFTALSASPPYTNSDGANPSDLVVSSDGSVYGATYGGGANGSGTIFRFPPGSSQITILHTFSVLSASKTNSDGSGPYDPIIGLDGNLYGTTLGGGTNGTGTVFRITSSGTLTTMYSFSAVPATSPYTNSDGANPDGALVVGPDGNFYGATYKGGTYGSGTIFRITPAGVLTTLHVFTAKPNGHFTYASNDGGYPEGSLIVGSDGNFYGTTQYGGLDAVGTIFRVIGPERGYGASEKTNENTPVTFTLAYDDPSGFGVDSIAFPTTPAHGTVAYVSGSITETGTTGTFSVTYTPTSGYHGPDRFTYAVTGYSGGAGSSEPQIVALTVNPTLPPPVLTSISPSSATAGGPAFTVTATGTNFASGAMVGWNGTPLVTTYFSATQLTANVPASDIATAGTASVTVSNPGGGTSGVVTFTIMTAPTGPVITATGVSPATLPVAGGTVTVSATVTDSVATLSYYPSVEVFKDGVDTGESFYLNTTGNYTTGGPFTGTYSFPVNDDISAHTYTFKITSTDMATPTPNTTTVTATGSTVQANDTTPPSITATGVSPATLPVTGGLVTVSATVTDTGNNNTGLSFYPNVEVYKNGVDTGQQFYLNTTGDYTHGGGAFTGHLTIPVNYDTSAAAYTFKITATDNVSPTPNSTAVTVGPATQANDTTAPVITATGVSPATLSASGGAITVSATVTDSGSSNTGLSYFPLVEVYKDGTDTGQQFYLNTTGDYTHGGGAFTGTFTAPANTDADYDKYTFVITATDNVSPTPHTTTVTATGSCLVASSQTQPAPTLTSISPASGPVNTAVTLTLTGTNFGYRSTVKFGSLAIAPGSVSATQLTATVPASVLTTAGTVSVTVVNGSPGGGTSAAKTFTITAASEPTVTLFTPTSGPVGTVVTLTGTNLNGVTAVRFHNANAVTFSANAQGTQLTVTVPTGAGTGTITVTTPGGSVKTATAFTVTTPPTIMSFTPTSGPAATVTVTITGKNLNGVTAVRFHNASAKTFSANAQGTQLTVTVPSGAGTGTITVTTPGGSVKTATAFTVTP